MLKSILWVVAVLSSFAVSFPTISRTANTPSSSLLYASICANDRVLIFGGTGGVGQLVTRRLLQQYPSIQLRIVTRDVQRAADTLRVFSSDSTLGVRNIELVLIDTLTPTDPQQIVQTEQQLTQAMYNVSAIVISVGTTAFPTSRWKNGNTPKAIDSEAVARIVRIASNLQDTNKSKPFFPWPLFRGIAAAAAAAAVASSTQSLKRMVLVTSIGVERTNIMPFVFLNLFKVLDAKRDGELAVIQGATTTTTTTTNQVWDYAIVRPGRLVGGPYTNLDVAKLMQIDGGNEFGAILEKGDSLLGDCKRITCADAIVQCLFQDQARNIDFSIISAPGSPWTNQEWKEAFTNLTFKNN